MISSYRSPPKRFPGDTPAEYRDGPQGEYPSAQGPPCVTRPPDQAGPPRSSGIRSPASTATGSRFSAGGRGQVARSVQAHGRLPARLKPTVTRPSASGGSIWRARLAAYVVTPEVASVNRTVRAPGSLPLKAVSRLGPQRGHVGTPAALADRFAHWVRHGAVDGFNITPYLIPDGLDDIVDLLVPELQERGVYPTRYTGTTLREHLGLRAPLTHRATHTTPPGH